MDVLIVTDAWHPQTNGVVRTLENVAAAARELGADISFLTPEPFRTFPLPSYPEIRVAVAWPGTVARRLSALDPDHVHIATEGPLGIAANRWCRARKACFTTSYHTRFPEYIRQRFPVPERLSYAWLRHFHNAAAGVMVATPSLAGELAARGFQRILPWGRGVDADLFRPIADATLPMPGPIFLFVGRIAPEKNLEAFLKLDLPGSKVLVGDGPSRTELQAKYPAAHFLGLLHGEDLARAYAASDVFVFPSLTDTFGVVVLEAMAAGVPVAAFPVTGPLDTLEGTGAGVVDWDLKAAALAALAIPASVPRAVALRHSWEACARSFLANIRAARTSAGDYPQSDDGDGYTRLAS